MDYKYSTLLPKGIYGTDGLCDGIPVRVHSCPEFEVAGALEAQRDWTKMVSSLEKHEGGLGPNYGFMAVSMPECLPKRFHIVSYANEFAFLYDDIVDNATSEQVDIQNDELLMAFENGARGNISHHGSGKGQIQAKIMSEMMRLDRKGAITAMKAWAKFVESSSGREHHKAFKSLDEYLPYRCKDVGHMFWHALVTFGCDLVIPENEFKAISDLVMPAVTAASLTNDLFSYEKEYHATIAAGKTEVPNGLWIIMKEHRIPLDEAKKRCQSLIKESVKEYVQVVKDIATRFDLSVDSRRYVELMQYSVSGNVIWSRECPRYHSLSQVKEISQYPDQIFQPNPMGHLSVFSRHDSLPLTPSESITSPQDYEGHHNKLKASKSLMGTAILSRLDPLDDSLLTSPMKGLGADVVLDPVRYLSSIPSKGVRSQVIQALNYWLNVPAQRVDIVRSVVNMLHSSSLMLDDLEDHSQLRRGRPSTHTIYGMSQTINSATFLYVNALDRLSGLQCPEALAIFTEEVSHLFIGQSYDLYWARELICPTVTEYLQMVDGKTGGLFRLLTRLLVQVSPHRNHVDLETLTYLFARYFQIRDDYQNLVSSEYTAQKGFCEDLDEGKYSLPLIYTLHNTDHGMRLRGLLQRRRFGGQLSLEQKAMMLELMREAGGLEYTLRTLQTLHQSIEAEITQLEHCFRNENFELRLLLNMLAV